MMSIAERGKKTSSRKYYYFRRPIGDPSETDKPDRIPQHATSETDRPDRRPRHASSETNMPDRSPSETSTR